MSRLKCTLTAVLVASLSLIPSAVLAASSCGSTTTGLIDSRSSDSRLGADVVVGATPVVLASTTMFVCESHPVLLHAAGNWFHYDGAPLAEMRIRVDGVLLPNLTAMFFSGPARHPFSVVGAANLTAGSHTIELVAMRTLGSGNFVVQATAQIAAVVGFNNVNQTVLPADVYVDQANPLEVASLDINAGGGGVFLNHTGTVHRVGDSGDALTQIAVDGQAQPTLGINDLKMGHEEVAPISAVAAMVPSNGTHHYGLVTNRLVAPNYPNTVKYNLLRGSSLVAAYGGETGAALSSGAETLVNLNSPSYLETVSFTLPTGHNGNAWISTNGRWLDLQNSGVGGTVAAVIELDGVQVGSWAVQYFEPNETISQRNFSLGYLAKSLQPGQHTVRLVVKKTVPGDPATDMPNFNVTAKNFVLW